MPVSKEENAGMPPSSWSIELDGLLNGASKLASEGEELEVDKSFGRLTAWWRGL